MTGRGAPWLHAGLLLRARLGAAALPVHRIQS